MTDLRQDSMTGEQWVFEERTADPASTEEGERWLRTDLNTGDKIATLRVDVGSTIRNVPIFSTGTAVDTVSEAMRLQVNGVTGYVPIVPVSDAAFPELRMQHNSQVHGFHDRVEPGSAIPDSEDLHARYDATELSLSDGDSVSSWPDATGNGYDLSGTATFEASGFNGEPSVSFDGVDDHLDVAFSSISEPYHIFGAVQLIQNTTADEYVYDSEARRDAGGFASFSGNNWGVNQGSYLTGPNGSADTNPHVSNTLFAGTDSVKVDGTEIVSGNAGSLDLQGFGMGRRADGARYANVRISEILIYPNDKSSIESNVESYLADKWGVTI